MPGIFSYSPFSSNKDPFQAQMRAGIIDQVLSLSTISFMRAMNERERISADLEKLRNHLSAFLSKRRSLEGLREQASRPASPRHGKAQGPSNP